MTSCTSAKRPNQASDRPNGKASVADLTGGGIVVVDSESDVGTPRPGSIVVVRARADRMLAEVQGKGGILGADIDALAPLPDGAPPMSYFVAAWISQADSPGAKTAAEWMGQQDWTHSSDVVFPMAVVALFSADALQHLDAELPPAAGSASDSARAMGATIVPAAFTQEASGQCTEVTDFLGRTLTAIFDALRISPSSIAGLPPVLSATVGFFAGLWNSAVSFAEGVVKGLVKTLTAPIVAALKIGLGALSVATVVVSYLRTWTLTVSTLRRWTPTPTGSRSMPSLTSTVSSAPAHRRLADDWPAALRDCANVAGVPLPQLLAPGSEATWTIEHNDGVVAIDKLQTVVESDRTMRLQGHREGADRRDRRPGRQPVAVRRHRHPRQHRQPRRDRRRRREGPPAAGTERPAVASGRSTIERRQGRFLQAPPRRRQVDGRPL